MVTVEGTLLGQTWANVYGVRLDVAAPLEEFGVAEIAEAFHTFYAGWASTLHTSWSAQRCVVADLQTALSPSYSAPFDDVVGLDSSQPMPPNMAVVASHRTGLRGKSYNGRTYLCGFTEQSNDASGQVLSTNRLGVETLFENLRTDLAALTTVPSAFAVLSRKLLVATPIVETTCDSEWDHQDRRKRR